MNGSEQHAPVEAALRAADVLVSFRLRFLILVLLAIGPGGAVI